MTSTLGTSDRIIVSRKTATPGTTNSPGQPGRFTLDGSDGLEIHLARTCARVLDGVQNLIPTSRFEGLLLGGGYGRGEGGVLKTPAGDRPYNDLEFYVFVRGNDFLNERRYRNALHELGWELTLPAGADVEFKVISQNKLRRSPSSMFYYDLVTGYRRLWGDETLFAGCDHHRHAQNLPLSEATRLLMNRCSGLLLAREKLKNDPLPADDADFIGRNLAKAQLALGDAVLTVFGEYHWSCRERHDRLLRLRTGEYLPWMPEVRLNHAAGVDFKFHPRRTPEPSATLQVRHYEITALALKIWLWLESRRLKRCFTSARSYALDTVNKCPETEPWRNRLVNASVFGPMAFFRKINRRHPRERILNALALLFWEPYSFDAGLFQHLQNQLGLPLNHKTSLIDEYRALWRRCN